MTCTVLFATLLLASPAAAAQERTDTSFTVPARGTLTLSNHTGRILVRGEPGNRVRVRATHPSQMQVEVRHSGDNVQVRETVRSGALRDVQYEVTVPHGWDVRLTGHRTGIVVESTRGTVWASSNRGDMIVRDVAAATLQSVNGEIRLTRARGDVRAEAVNDAINVSDVQGNVDVSTVNGSVILGSIDGMRVRGSTVNGRVQFSGAIRRGGDYSFDTHNGDVTLTVAPDIGADVTVATHGGNIEADFPVQVRGDISRRGVLEFTIGGGGARLHARSFNGAIRLLRSDRGRS